MSGRAFGGNWQSDQRKRDNAAKRRDAERADDARVAKLEQQRFTELARAHRHEHAFFESVASQIDAGRPLSKKQAATLLAVAGERGWSTKATRQTAPNPKQGKIEVELRDYAGDDPTLLAFAERWRRSEHLTNSERSKANWLLQQERLR